MAAARQIGASSRRLIWGPPSAQQQIVAGIDTHPAVTLTYPSSASATRKSELVGSDGIAARAGRIALGRRNARPLAGVLKRRDSLSPGRIPAQALHLRTVNAVVHGRVSRSWCSVPDPRRTYRQRPESSPAPSLALLNLFLALASLGQAGVVRGSPRSLSSHSASRTGRLQKVHRRW